MKCYISLIKISPMSNATSERETRNKYHHVGVQGLLEEYWDIFTFFSRDLGKASKLDTRQARSIRQCVRMLQAQKKDARKLIMLDQLIRVCLSMDIFLSYQKKKAESTRYCLDNITYSLCFGPSSAPVESVVFKNKKKQKNELPEIRGKTNFTIHCGEHLFLLVSSRSTTINNLILINFRSTILEVRLNTNF